ncbi:MAG: ABC transporter ATP-binding protein [candidate division Zixibacteria bacterium]|nr:ABC transporter ATP-binding protein [candidate division Zixibacteria bacterium]
MEALKDVNLDIGSGMFGLLGPNGAGKTTLMRILVTLMKPTAGQVTIDGLDLLKKRKEIRRMLGYLPQEFSVFSRLKTWEFLDYAARLGGIRSRKQRLEKVDRMLEEVGLFDARERKASKLSGGMKRRLGIAQTLISDPRIMVVDEPTVGLDPEERLRFRNILADLSRKDMIVILSTHIVGDISSTCTDMAVLNDGKIVFNGSPESLVESARDKVWRVIASDYELDELKQNFPVISTVPSERGWEVRLVGSDVPGHQVEQVEPNLEDAYICFMQEFSDDGNVLAEHDSW